MKPNVRYSFDIKFEEQLVRALKGHAPWKNKMPAARGGTAKPPSEKQLHWLKKFGKTAETAAEASRILSECFAK